MAGFDDLGVYFSDNLDAGGESDSRINNQGIVRRCKDFLRSFHDGNFQYKYR